MEKKGKRKNIHIHTARIYITSSFNNTIITLTDEHGNVVAWASSGSNGFKGTKKGTPFAAQLTMSKILEKVNMFGIKQVHIFVSGPGPGRETALRTIAQSSIKILSIRDVTPIPHNGCRPPKPRRV